tara:strand:- start:402 stop:1613 length:1212 start_codon:yes stop_codon:yes gene_type:complete
MEQTPAEMAQEITNKIEAIKTEVSNAVSKDDFTALETKLQVLTSSVEDAEATKNINDLQEQINVLKEKNEMQKDVLKTIDGVLEANKDAIKESFLNKKDHNFTINKALTLSSAVANNTDSFRDDTLSPLATKKLAIYDLFKKVRIGKNNAGTISYRDWDAATTVRAAAMVAEGAAFPESTVAWEQFSINIKKIGDSIPYTAEFEYDLARFADELRDFLGMNVKLVEDAQLRAGDGTGTNIFGLETYAPAYVPAASGISDASRYDLIVKVSEDLTKGLGNKFRANYAIMNLTEINKMRLKKDANENYIMPPFVDRNGNVVAGVQVIEDNGFANNTMIVGDSRYGTIYEDEDGYTITTGLVGNQFLEDEETLKARKRMCFLIKESEKVAHRKVTSISAALVTLAS